MEEGEGAPMAAGDGVPVVSPDRASALATFEATRVRNACWCEVLVLYAVPIVPIVKYSSYLTDFYSPWEKFLVSFCCAVAPVSSTHSKQHVPVVVVLLLSVYHELCRIVSMSLPVESAAQSVAC